MKKKTKLILRFVGIGTLHAVLYLVVVPFVILPLFAGTDSKLIFGIVGGFSVVVAAWIFMWPIFKARKNQKLENSDED